MARRRGSAFNSWATLSILVAVSACGGGGSDGGTPPPPASVSTLAYVVTECRTDAAGGTMRQRLEIRQGDQAPITVGDTPTVESPSVGSVCSSVGADRSGTNFARYGVFHRLGVTPDGSHVVFEVTDDDRLTLFPRNGLPAEQEGIFIVGADGTDLHRLEAASSNPPYVGFNQSRPFFAFSPNGRTVAYTDRGPSSDGQDAVQIVTLDLDTGGKVQLTHLPPATRTTPVLDDTCCPEFEDDQTITFLTYANVGGKNPTGERIIVTVHRDHPDSLDVSPPAVAVPGSLLTPILRITGADVSVAVLSLAGTPVNGLGFIQEVFVYDGENLLQLTNFRRLDTIFATLSADGQRVFFSASADPLGSNPSENCQIFSIDRNGGDLRQLTDFHEGPHSRNGCLFGRPPLGCPAGLLGRDTQSDDVVFYSSCDPFGTNPYGSQVFAMHPDGTGLRQLTNTQKYTSAQGTVAAELPYPFAYPRQQN